MGVAVIARSAAVIPDNRERVPRLHWQIAVVVLEQIAVELFRKNPVVIWRRCRVLVVLGAVTFNIYKPRLLR